MSARNLLWPMERLGEGLEELARRSGLRPASEEPIAVPDAVLRNADEFDPWMMWAGRRLGVDIEPVEVMAAGVEDLVRRGGPAVIRVQGDAGPGFLFLLRARFGGVRVITPDLVVRRVEPRALRDLVCAPFEAPLLAPIDNLLTAADIAVSRRGKVRGAIVNERLAEQRVGGFWMLGLPTTAPFARQLSHIMAPRRLAATIALFAAVYGLEIAGWSLIGGATLNGHIDLGWLGAWALLVVTMIPLRLMGGWIDSALAIDISVLLKIRLLSGALRFDVERVKREGVGQLLGRVMECQALESLAVNGGLAAFVAVMELGFAFWILAIGAGGGLHVALLAGWLVVTCAMAWRFYARVGQWTSMRLSLTHDLIEQMVGHRTRLAQEWPQRRDEFEDSAVKNYLTMSSVMDRAILPFVAGVPGGWMLIGLAGLAPAFISGAATPVTLAIGLGGVLVAHRALSGFAGSLAAVARAAIAWKQAGPLFQAGGAAPARAPWYPRRVARTGAHNLIDADAVTFRYEASGDPVLDKASLAIRHGERILLEGASGGGKSTLASLLVGLRRPESGLLLLNGLDRHTLGDGWRSIATEAPQFHENHIFNATMGFNLLMGKNWPASEAEMKLAEDLCIELGLGDLMKRMPSGMMQTVGETGWQLSHGERCRVFLARALLQDAELTILDESFAALDPETLERCLQTVFERARTLVVIAHP